MPNDQNEFDPGRARYLVTIEQLAGTQDATGQQLWSWSTFTTAWAEIRGLSGYEHLAAAQLVAGVSAVILIRINELVTPKMRITYGQRHWDILAAFDPTGARKTTKMLCNERVESGQPGE